MGCYSDLLVQTVSAIEAAAVEARIVGSTTSRLSHVNDDLEVNFHEKSSVCGHRNPDGLMNHLRHDPDDHFRRQSLTLSLGDTSHC